MNNNKELTTTQLIKTARQSVVRLVASQGKDWRTGIPARPNKDDDLILTEAINRLEVLQRRVEALEAFNEDFTTEFDEDDW